MKKYLSVVILSTVVIVVSCDSKWKINDKTGALGKTQAPVSKVVRLNESQNAAAREGRLGLATDSKSEKEIIPVQFEFSDSGDLIDAVMLIPEGESGKRQFEWAEDKNSFESTMRVNEDSASGQSIISDNGKTVLQYNYKTVFERDALDTLSANKYIVTPNDTFMANPSIYAVPRSNYIHPIYGPNGEMLTRDWSKDHPHHRGIYWAWPEVDFGTKRGDLHALQIVFARPTGKIKYQSGPLFAQIEAENLWMWKDSVSIVNEVAVIRVYMATPQGRIIDLAFRFTALKDSITIARRGTHLYGGLNVRMQTPKSQNIFFHTDSSDIVPRRSWSDLSGLFAGAEVKSGMMVLQHQQNPDYPGDWVQYPELSWCQPTFPAANTRYPLLRGKSLVLRYRILVHDGTLPDKERSAMLWDSFNSEMAPKLSFSFSEPEFEK
jgi:hypothetical protein